jgi:hypothetical protein
MDRIIAWVISLIWYPFGKDVRIIVIADWFVIIYCVETFICSNLRNGNNNMRARPTTPQLSPKFARQTYKVIWDGGMVLIFPLIYLSCIHSSFIHGDSSPQAVKSRHNHRHLSIHNTFLGNCEFDTYVLCNTPDLTWVSLTYALI